MEFVGRIYLRDSSGPTTHYWTEIESVAVEGKTLTISGTSSKNKGTPASCTYNDPDDFLLQLGVYLRGQLGGKKKM